MQPLDNDFFEEYKRLDRICSDMYSSRNGISQYISDMESQSRRGECAIPNWRLVYRDLLHLRHLRNQIAHESGEYPFCSEEDIETLRELSNEILTQRDPLSLLYQYEQTRKQKTIVIEWKTDSTTETEATEAENKTSDGSVFVGLIVLGLAIFLVLGILYLLYA